MSYLLDTGILLRLVDQTDALHPVVEQVVGHLGNKRIPLHITSQNIAEFWNVATRPKANNGLELSPTETAQAFSNAIEPICAVLPELLDLTAVFTRLLTTHNVVGKQVHDARLVAMMLSWQVDGIVTLNERNFRRFEPEGISVLTPGDLLAP
jgi:predicted nucleic acid-binding protein